MPKTTFTAEFQKDAEFSPRFELGRRGLEEQVGTYLVIDTLHSGPPNSLKVDQIPAQNGSGKPSPTNRRPFGTNPRRVTVYINGAEKKMELGIADAYFAGVFDFISGIYLETWYPLTIGELPWELQDAQRCVYAVRKTSIDPAMKEDSRVLCTVFDFSETATPATLPDNTMCRSSYGLHIRCTAAPTVSALNAIIAGQRIAYEIADPWYTLDLGAPDVSLIMGENVLSTTGNCLIYVKTEQIINDYTFELQATADQLICDWRAE